MEAICHRKFRDLCASGTKQAIRDNAHSSTAGLRNRLKGCRELFRATRLEHPSTQIQRQRGCFHLASYSCMGQVLWVHEQRDDLQARHDLLEELHPFAENVEAHT